MLQTLSHAGCHWGGGRNLAPLACHRNPLGGFQLSQTNQTTHDTVYFLHPPHNSPFPRISSLTATPRKTCNAPRTRLTLTTKATSQKHPARPKLAPHIPRAPHNQPVLGSTGINSRRRSCWTGKAPPPWWRGRMAATTRCGHSRPGP